MAQFISPGVYVREIDLSDYIPAIATSIFAVVGTAPMGPVNSPTIITNKLALATTFGSASPSYPALYSAEQYLNQGRQLIYVRVTDGTEANATVSIPGAAQIAFYKSPVDIGAGVNLSSRKFLQLNRDGIVQNIDISAGFAGPITAVTIEHIISKINLADASYRNFSGGTATTNFASKDNLNAHLVLRSEVVGALGLVAVQAYTTDVNQDAARIIFNLQALPKTVNGLALAATALIVTAVSPGIWANGYSAFIQNGTNTGTFKLTLKTFTGESISGESFDNLTKETVESVVNAASLFMRVDDNGNLNPPNPSTLLATTPVGIDFYLAGGLDGISAIGDDDYIGINDIITGEKTGLKALENAETLDINIIAVPGISSGSVVLELLALCQRRADCFAIIDPPIGLSVQSILDYHNGAGAYAGLHPAFNSSYGAVYYPWVEVFDAVNNIKVFTPPSGWVAGQMAYTDFVSDPWFAPAGLSRGLLPTALRVERDLDKGEQDFLQGNGNAVNPILNLPKDGIVIFGQRTLQRRPTALDRINVRRMLLFAEKVIATVSKFLVFEPNDPQTWARAENLINPILSRIKAGRGIEEFFIRIDETTNTPDARNSNELRGKLFIIPTKSAEKIILDFILLPSGAEFEGV